MIRPEGISSYAFTCGFKNKISINTKHLFCCVQQQETEVERTSIFIIIFSLKKCTCKWKKLGLLPSTECTIIPVNYISVRLLCKIIF